MTFDWQEYLVLSRTLYDNHESFADREACLRACISRSYYAVFCKARNCAIDYDRQTIPRDGSAHYWVKTFYTLSSERKRRRVGILLDRLRISRNQADYANTIISLLSTSEVALENASEIMQLLKEIYPAL